MWGRSLRDKGGEGEMAAESGNSPRRRNTKNRTSDKMATELQISPVLSVGFPWAFRHKMFFLTTDRAALTISACSGRRRTLATEVRHLADDGWRAQHPLFDPVKLQLEKLTKPSLRVLRRSYCFPLQNKLIIKYLGHGAAAHPVHRLSICHM